MTKWRINPPYFFFIIFFFLDGAPDCSICHESKYDKKMLLKLQCGHDYHKKCIADWFKIKRECPECRSYEIEKEEFPALGAGAAKQKK